MPARPHVGRCAEADNVTVTEPDVLRHEPRRSRRTGAGRSRGRSTAATISALLLGSSCTLCSGWVTTHVIRLRTTQQDTVRWQTSRSVAVPSTTELRLSPGRYDGLSTRNVSSVNPATLRMSSTSMVDSPKGGGVVKARPGVGRPNVWEKTSTKFPQQEQRLKPFVGRPVGVPHTGSQRGGQYVGPQRSVPGLDGEDRKVPAMRKQVLLPPLSEAEARALTTRLTHAAQKDGVQGLLDMTAKSIDYLNTLHCAMILGRISREKSDYERKRVISDPRFSLLMERFASILHLVEPRDLSQAVNSLSRMRDPQLSRWSSLIRRLQAIAEETTHEMDVRQLALVINGFANLQPPPSTAFLDTFTGVFCMLNEEFDKQGLAMVANAYGKLGYNPGLDTLRLIEGRSKQTLLEANTQELSNILNAFGKLEYVPSAEYMEVFAAISLANMTGFKPQELAITLNGLAKIGYRPTDEWLQTFERAAIERMNDFKPQESAIIVNGFTKMTDYVPSREFFLAVQRCIINKVTYHRAQETANTLHGLGKLGFDPTRDFCEAFVQHAIAIMHTFKCQELANLVNGLSKMSYRPPLTFFTNFIEAALPKVSHFNPQEMSNVVNGLMRLGWRPDVTFLEKTADASFRRISEFKDQELAVTVHAYGRMLFFPGHQVMAAIEKECADRVVDMHPQAMTITLNAFSRLGWKPRPSLLSAMEAGLTTAIGEGKIVGAELAQILNALANLNHVPGRSFMSTLKSCLLDSKACLDLSTVAVVLWSLSALDVPNMKLFLAKMIDVACKRLEGEAPQMPHVGERASMYYSALDEEVPTVGDERLEPPIVMCVRQLLQTCRYLTTLKNPVDQAVYRKFGELLERHWAVAQKQKYETSTSLFHMEVMATLEKAFGLRCESEVEDEAYTLDMVIDIGDGGLPVVIEADGPHHFFRNAPEEPMGFTRFKHRMLMAQHNRWRAVISVPHGEWLRASREENGRTNLLIAKLSEGGIDVRPLLQKGGALP